MKKARLIPAMDIIDGKCVRLEKGDYSKKKTYTGDPLAIAKEFEDHGLRYLHLVDLDGAKAGKLIHWKLLERICHHTSLIVDIGGGIKTEADLKTVFEAGASQANIGSLAAKKPEIFSSWLQLYGAERLILSADVTNKMIAINGWQEGTSLSIIPFIRSFLDHGLQTVTCTDIQKDGMLEGSSVELYQHILEEIPNISLIASGGVSKLADIQELDQLGVEGIIIGKAIYEKKISLKELSAFSN